MMKALHAKLQRRGLSQKIGAQQTGPDLKMKELHLQSAAVSLARQVAQ